MIRPRLSKRLVAAMPLALMVNAIFVASASAHVKWFAHYDVAQQPIALKYVFIPEYGYLALLSIVALLVGSLLEHTFIGEGILRALDRVTGPLERNTELMFRAGCAFFFIAIWGAGNIILTPELHSRSVVIGAIQLGIALGMLWRSTMPLSALGMAALYGIGVWKYGLFHMADYPIFLGIAAYIALTGLQRDFFGIRAIDVVRWGAGITLLWASIEKWAYPEWSYPLFGQHPNLSVGLSPDFYMRAAGWVEFALAFALLWTPLVRRVGAIILTGMFVGAVFGFGKIDLIGHSLIVVVLLSIIADSRRESALIRHPGLLPFGVTGALAVVISLYYGGHALIYNTTVFNGPKPQVETLAMAIAMCGDTPAHFTPTLTAYTANRQFLVKLDKLPDPIPYQKYFTIGFTVYDGHDPTKKLQDASLQLFAGMRHGMPHGFAHGMQSSPRIVDKDGTLTAEGMYFHMQGRWTLRATVAQGDKQGVAYFDVPCCDAWVNASR
jgi:hypothetical protein